MSRKLSRLTESLDSPGAESRRAATVDPPPAIRSRLATAARGPPTVSSFLLATSFIELNVLCNHGGHELRAACNSARAECS
jgi:hypothetical protein